MTLKTDEGLSRLVERVLACPLCHSPLRVRGSGLSCAQDECAFRGSIDDDIVLVGDHASSALFDSKHAVMQHGSDKPGVRALCYSRQAAFVEEHLQSTAKLVVDVGCGPRLPYARTGAYTLVGLDPSYESLRQNHDVDVRIYGHAGQLPLPDASVDAVLSLYAIHHFGGANLRENQARVEQAFTEFGRVLKPGADLFIFELEPWWLAWKLQATVWDLARRLFPGFDILFWRERRLKRAYEARIGRPSRYERTSFGSPLFMTFAPVFALPGVRIPRLFFPFSINLYHWRV